MCKPERNAHLPETDFWGSLRDFSCPVWGRALGLSRCKSGCRQLTRAPKELIHLLVSPDALGVARGRESRIRYNSVDVTAGLAY